MVWGKPIISRTRAGHRAHTQVVPLVAFWWDSAANRPRYQVFAGSHSVGKAGDDSAAFIISACEYIQGHMEGGGGASINWAGSMTDGASNMMCTQARALTTKFGRTFVVANCAMHVMSLVMSVPYLCAYPAQQKVRRGGGGARTITPDRIHHPIS